eukprot:19422-Eustigmatos_ZCMA.PRE.1
MPHSGPRQHTSIKPYTLISPPSNVTAMPLSPSSRTWASRSGPCATQLAELVRPPDPRPCC